jgi:glutamate formiminotransferase / formiminotetrahydrofolate cyclodeaminase
VKIVECVPNFSEGRRLDVIAAIREAAASVRGVTVLDCEHDPNHNRMVLTFVGNPETVKEAAIASSAIAIKLIDLRTHTGEHPRMGAVDVVPFVPLREVSMEDCVSIANEFARDYSNRFAVPVFLYEYAARRPERKDLAKVREGQFEGLRELIGKDPSKDPDYGPRSINPSAGATAVGARPILIAYNVNLNTNDLSVAKKIAHLVRGRDGGLPTVKALGFELKDRGIVQVSMNLTDYKVTSICKAYDQVSKHASELKVPVLQSEIVGLVPLDALIDASTFYLKLATFNSNQIIENRLFTLAENITPPNPPEVQIMGKDFSKMSLVEFSTAVSSGDPTPGGGTVAAYTGVLAASLVIMVCKLTLGKKGYESVYERAGEIKMSAEESKTKLMRLASEDSIAYSKVSHAFSLPKITEEEKSTRKKEINSAVKESTEVPLETMTECLKIRRLAAEVLRIGNKNANSDAETALELASSAAKGAWSNVKINLEALVSDMEFVERMKAKIQPLTNELNLV